MWPRCEVSTFHSELCDSSHNQSLSIESLFSKSLSADSYSGFSVQRCRSGRVPSPILADIRAPDVLIAGTEGGRRCASPDSRIVCRIRRRQRGALIAWFPRTLDWARRRHAATHHHETLSLDGAWVLDADSSCPEIREVEEIIIERQMPEDSYWSGRRDTMQLDCITQWPNTTKISVTVMQLLS